MREFSTRTTEGHYTIIFETDERKAFEQVQTLCRILIDGKDGEAIPIEWLLKERDKNKNIVEKLRKEDLDIDFVSKYLCKHASHRALMIEEILLDWRAETKDQEKENETN